MSEPLDGFQFRRTEAGLWVPAGGRSHALGLVIAQSASAGLTLVLPDQPPMSDGFMAYATESDLGLAPLGEATIVEWLSMMPSEFTFLNLAILLRQVNAIRAEPLEHLRLAREIYGDDAPVVAEMGRFCAEEGHVIFSEQGLFALLCQAIVHCRDEPKQEFTEAEGTALRRLLLAAPCLLHDDVESGDFADYYPENPEEWLAYLTQNLLFNASQNFGSGLARTWRIFGEMAIASDRESTSKLDYPALIAATGLDVVRQLALAFGLYAILGMGKAGPVAILPSGWQDMCQRVAPDLDPDDVIAGIAKTPEAMRAELAHPVAQRLDPNLRWASVPFLEKPFLRLSDDRLLLVSPRAIEGWATHGVYYRLLAAAKRADRRNGANDFTSLAGDLTQAYALELLERAHDEAPGVQVGRVIREVRLANGTDTVDAFIVEGGDVVLIEISSSRVTLPTRLAGDVAALRSDFFMLVVKRVEQLHRTAETLLAGDIEGLPEPDEIRRIFPVIVNVEPLQWSPQLHAYLTKEAPGLLQQSGMQPLQFMELEDLEWLVALLGRWSIPRLLAVKLETVGVDADIQRFLQASHFAIHATRPAVVTRNLDRMYDAIAEHLGFSVDQMQAWRDTRA